MSIKLAVLQPGARASPRAERPDSPGLVDVAVSGKSDGLEQRGRSHGNHKAYHPAYVLLSLVRVSRLSDRKLTKLIILVIKGAP